jgi:hypothetical protein
MLQVQLKPGVKGERWAYLRPLCGHDEAWINGSSLVEVAWFLDRLLVSVPGTSVASGKASELAVCDCDRLFAALYLTYFGDQVESTVTCRSCGNPFELRFSLRELMASLDPVVEPMATGPDDDGVYTLIDGRRFRLPTVGDRDSLIGLDPEQALTVLLKRCVVEGDPMLDLESLQSAMNEAGSMVDLDLDAACVQCGTSQMVQFDIQTYVLQTLAFEQRYLKREVHCLAMTYGWGYQEILDLPREDRRTFVQLIQTDRGLQSRKRL